MKKFIQLFILLGVAMMPTAMNVEAQGFYIYKTDGSRICLMNAEVDSINESQGKYIYKTDCTIERLLNAEVDSIVAFEKEYPFMNAHKAVDLGLSVKWATCNVGAESPYEFGGLYGWADATGEKTSTRNYDYLCGGLSNICGDERYDIARARWGEQWRLPTKSEMEELRTKCKWVWTTKNAIEGYLITGTNGNTIFLPAAGYRNGTTISYYDTFTGTSHDGEYKTGRYWTGTLSYYDSGWDGFAWCLSFQSVSVYMNDRDRCYGCSVRPVTE